ncbi:MAG TPA: phosphoglycerate mutase family protein [Thermoanaerobaculia bacterium]|jgi:broad specificity phosphatase PhoE
MRTIRAAFLTGVLGVLFFGLSGSALAQRAIFVVRHAEKVSSSDERLSEAGQQRAVRLAKMLMDAGVSAIYSTDTPRTRGTVQPLADALKLQVQIYDVGSQKVDAKAFARRLRQQHVDQVVLVVGHSNTVPEILRALGCQESVTIGPDEYDDLFVVIPRGKGAGLVRLRY